MDLRIETGLPTLKPQLVNNLMKCWWSKDRAVTQPPSTWKSQLLSLATSEMTDNSFTQNTLHRVDGLNISSQWDGGAENDALWMASGVCVCALYILYVLQGLDVCLSLFTCDDDEEVFLKKNSWKMTFLTLSWTLCFALLADVCMLIEDVGVVNIISAQH